ncbi:hypothetical protein [Sphingomonas sp.]|uniref:hypothetical protein n=1 Tax=Sphingomonas sp. TaxID=28214 RepID=UPI0031CE19B2
MLTGKRPTRLFATGYRFGSGRVLAVVRPAAPAEQFAVLAAYGGVDVIVIAQAANTGLTGGSPVR